MPGLAHLFHLDLLVVYLFKVEDLGGGFDHLTGGRRGGRRSGGGCRHDPSRSPGGPGRLPPGQSGGDPRPPASGPTFNLEPRRSVAGTYKINNKALLYSPGNDIQYPVINHNGKEYERNKYTCGLPRWLRGKESACQGRDRRDAGSIPGSGRSPGVGNGNPLQFSCLENTMDRRPWWATAHGVTKGQTWLIMHSYIQE